MLRRWLSALADNARIRADYPGETAPFAETTHPVRLRLLRWKDTGELAGADVRLMDGALVLPDGRGAIGAASVGGNTRGLFATMPSGETLRPDVLFLDDPQDKPTAESPALVRKTVERIESDLLSLAGPQTRLSVMTACTVIEAGDVADARRTFNEDPGVALVISDVVLPDGNGVELVLAFREARPGLPVVLMSGYADERARWPDIRDRNLPFLQKPFSIAEILDTVALALARPAGA